MLKMAGHTRLEPKMRQIRQYKKGNFFCFKNSKPVNSINIVI